MLDVVAHALAQPIAPVRQILAEASIAQSQRLASRLVDFLLQLREAHRFHDPARVHALLREQLDLLYVDLLTRAVDGDVDLELIAARQQLSQRRARRATFRAASSLRRRRIGRLGLSRSVDGSQRLRSRTVQLRSLCASPRLPLSPPPPCLRRSPRCVGGRLSPRRLRRRQATRGTKREELIEARIERCLLVQRLRQHQCEAVLEQLPVAVADQLDRAAARRASPPWRSARLHCAGRG